MAANQSNLSTPKMPSSPARDRVGRGVPLLVVLAAVTGLLTLVTVEPAGAQPPPDEVITVVGVGVPRTDVANLNAAIAAGGRTHTTVQLIGRFDVGNSCNACVKITHPVEVVGTGDPTGPKLDPRTTTIIEGGRRGRAFMPFVVIPDPSDSRGRYAIRRLWFRKGSGVQLGVLGTGAEIDLSIRHSRFTGLAPSRLVRTPIAVSGGTTGRTASGSLTLPGRFEFAHNIVDTLGTGPVLGDDNGLAVIHAGFAHASIVDNTFRTHGETEYLEGVNPEATIEFARNRIVMDAVPSLNGLIYPAGGHPAAIKLHANMAQALEVADNEVHAFGFRSGACILVDFPQEAPSDPPAPPSDVDGQPYVIRHNTCALSGMAIGLVGGYPPGEPFIGPGSLRNTLVIDNTFTGTVRRGIALIDYRAPPGFPPRNALVNDAHGNTFRDNHMADLTSSVAALDFGRHTHDNLFVGDPNGRVVDRGTDNIILTPR